MPSTLLAIALLAVAFTQGGVLDPAKLHGEWYHAYELPDGRTYEGYTIYREDGTFSDNSTIFYDGKEIDSIRIEGTWKLEGRQMTYKGKVIGHPSIPGEQPDVTCEITEITDERYSFKSPIDGSIQHETRVK
ncbi:hypothetical protein QEH56_00755 [Pelagicoccus enzymogenes]|uniref:hypothetical protein n=1 Tax=Pelagicoccus enzymogenes TaxID=2773457 RepID=UPI00280D1028|nr:hypothetical protein [Pelagicoccus enzymogenes]MDQ8196653.1 hypothetical protein [Pelagicoccus enzymogenes]